MESYELTYATTIVYNLLYDGYMVQNPTSWLNEYLAVGNNDQQLHESGLKSAESGSHLCFSQCF